jgi:RNA polymerase sigma-70 factor (ECF subfamily)
VEQSSKTFDNLVKENKDMIFNLLFRLTGDYHLSEDLFQETFIKAFNGLGDFNQKSKPSTWIYSIALNVFRDNNRRKRWRLLDHSTLENKEKNEGEDPADPETQFIMVEEKRAIQKKINKLKETLRIPLVLYYLEGLSIYQIARITGKTPDSIKVSLHRARKKLKNDWDDE